MRRQTYVNLAIKDLTRTVSFFSALGFTFDSRFTDEKAACLIIDVNVYVMLIVEEHFQPFTRKPIADAKQVTEVLIAISCATRAEVDELVAKAVAEGGVIARDPQDYGFMYTHAFEDPDGHIWELVYMDPAGPPA